MSEEVKNETVEETTVVAEEKAEVPAEFKELVEKVEKMSVLELHALVSNLPRLVHRRSLLLRLLRRF